MAQAAKIYPDNTLETRARDAGAQVMCMWQMKGPPNTAILWIECLLINGRAVLVETFEDGGWEAFSALPVNKIDATVSDVLNRCGVSDAKAEG